MKKIRSLFVKSLFLIIFLILGNDAFTQLKIEKSKSHRISFTYENSTDSVLYYFDPECFYVRKIDKKNKMSVTFRTNRTSFSHDSLYIFLNDKTLNYYGNSREVNDEQCIRYGPWAYKELLPDSCSKAVQICMRHKIEYKFLCVYFNISSTKSMLDYRTCLLVYDRETKKQTTYKNVQPLIKIGAYDTPNKPKGRIFGSR